MSAELESFVAAAPLPQRLVTAPVRPRRGLTQGTITEARVTDEVTVTVVFDSLAGIWHR